MAKPQRIGRMRDTHSLTTCGSVAAIPVGPNFRYVRSRGVPWVAATSRRTVSNRVHPGKGAKTLCRGHYTLDFITSALLLSCNIPSLSVPPSSASPFHFVTIRLRTRTGNVENQRQPLSPLTSSALQPRFSALSIVLSRAKAPRGNINSLVS